MSGNVLLSGLTEARCHLCSGVFPSDRLNEENTVLLPEKVATIHHIFFPARIFLSPNFGLSDNERRIIKNKYRNSSDHQAVLCMSKNGNTSKGCHNLLNDQLVNGCLGIKNPGHIEPNNGYSVVGRCPIIFSQKPHNPDMVLPNNFCEFCFFFQMLCEPKKYEDIIPIISKIPNFQGELSVEFLVQVNQQLRNDGYQVKRAIYPVGKTKASYIKRYKPVTT